MQSVIRVKIKKELAGRIQRGQTRGMTERDRKEDGRNLADRVTGARRKAIWFAQYPAGASVVRAIVSG